jgi:hypothetical protein
VEVEVEALAHVVLAIEREDDEHRERDLAAGRRQPPPGALVRASERSLHHDGVLGVVQLLQVVPEVGERRHVLDQQALDTVAPVVQLTGRHDLVSGAGEQRDGLVEAVGVLGFHVGQAVRFTPGSKRVVEGHGPRR